MKKELSYEGILNYGNKENEPPNAVVSRVGSQLKELTNGFIEGVVKEYKGHIESYSQPSSMASISAALGKTVVHRDIQKDLGAIGYETFTFEFYITSSMLETYKFRIFFFEYGMGSYPVKIVLEQGIADEVFCENDTNYVLEYSTKSELESLVTNILRTKRVISVMQDLINATERLIEERKENSLEEN